MNETDFIPMRDVWRDGSDALQGRRCPVCNSQLSSTRARYCSSACRNRAWRRRRDQIVFRSDSNLPGQPSWLPIYECPQCKRRLLGDHRRPDCNFFGSRLGLGGRCPHCDEPVLLTDLASAPAAL